MKNHLFTAVAALLAMASYAQEQESHANASKDIRFGIKAGLNVATIKGDVSDPSPRIGAHFGVTAEFKLSEKFSIQPELLYSMQGVKESVKEEIEGALLTGEGTTKLDYLNLPVMAKIHAAKGFTIEAGPQIGLLVGARVKYKLDYEGEHVSGSEDVSNDIKSLDFAFNAGLGYELPSGLFFQGRYSIGITNAYHGDDDTEGRNGVLQFSVGYILK